MDQVNKVEKIRCDACPVMCYIAEGKSGACDRYACLLYTSDAADE